MDRLRKWIDKVSYLTGWVSGRVGGWVGGWVGGRSYLVENALPGEAADGSGDFAPGLEGEEEEEEMDGEVSRWVGRWVSCFSSSSLLFLF